MTTHEESGRTLMTKQVSKQIVYKEPVDDVSSVSSSVTPIRHLGIGGNYVTLIPD